jgi:hypothetical protein
MHNKTNTLGVKNKTKKIISSIIITTLLFSWQTFADYDKKIESEERYKKLENYQIADNLYFPGWNYWMGMSKSSWPRTPYTFGENSYWYNLYNYLYFWNSEYKNNNLETLFKNINSKFNIEYRINGKNFTSYNTEEKLKKDLEKVILEIKVDKFRFQDDYKANKLEKDIENKLEKIYKQISESKWKTNSSLEFIKNEENTFCNNDLSVDYNFQTKELEKDNDIKKYYLFGLPYTNYYEEYNKENNINTLYYGSPWDNDRWNDNISNAFIISNEDDLKNIYKSKFYLQVINPEFINNEVTFTLKYNDYLEFFKQNHNLEKSWENYNFW